MVIGSRLNIRQVSYNWQSFAPHAFKIQVDIDPTEFAKPTVKPDMAIHCDAKLFLKELELQIYGMGWRPDHPPNGSPGVKNAQLDIQSFCRSIECLTDASTPIISWKSYSVASTVTMLWYVKRGRMYCGFQAGLQKGQRMFSNSGCASMGYDLPAALGTAVAREGGRVVCLAGDGSVQLNIQELQTIAHHRLPVKIFILNNGGYLSIRPSQTNFFGCLVGESPNSGVSFPDMVSVAHAYGLHAMKVDQANFGVCIDEALNRQGPTLCEVMLCPEQGFEPRLSSKQDPNGKIVSTSLEDMFPFLEREELKGNLLVPQESDNILLKKERGEENEQGHL